MIQRPAWWAVLTVLAGVAIAVPLKFRKMPARAREPAQAAPRSESEAPPATAPAVSLSSSTAIAPIAIALATAVVVDAPDPATPDAAPPVVVVVAPAWPPSAKYVLHVGDSSLGFEQGLALEMTTRFKAIGVRYEAITEAAAGLHSFATSKKLEELVRWKKPDVVLLSLGMNNLTVAKPEAYEPDVRSIVAQVGDRACWWIGPLSLDRPETGLIAMLGRTAAPCGFTSSYELGIERQPDHIHPTQRGASVWADAVWVAITPSSPRSSPSP